MFEQGTEKAAPVEKTQEGDLFHNYEIKHWHYGPRNYKILAASTLITFFTLVFIAQTDLLTRRGCESPWVGSVCTVLDMAYIGTVVYGTDYNYSDEGYEPVEISDADITYIDVTSETPPLTYPEGYFQIANPEEYAAMVAAQQEQPSTYNPTTTYPTTTYPSQSNDLASTPQQLPPTNPNAVEGDIPDSPFSVSETPNSTIVRKGRQRNRPNSNSNTNSDETVAQNDANANTMPTPMSSEAINAVVINRKPLNDFADSITMDWSTNKLDLGQPVSVTLNGVITAEGTLDEKKSKFDPTREKGDPKMINVAKSAFEALGASGFMTYLKSAGIDKITATLVQDDENLSIIISSPQSSVERARSVASVVSVAIMTGKLKVENPSDERTLLDAAKSTNDGKNYVLNFTIPKPVAQEMINRKLREAQAKKAQPQQPNSVSTRSGDGNTALK